MASAYMLNSNENIRKSNTFSVNPVKVPIKVHSPKVRLRLDDAKDNYEKSHLSTVQYNFMPPSLVNAIESKKKTADSNYRITEAPINRNKVCVMKELMLTSGGSAEVAKSSRCLGEESRQNLVRSRGVLHVVGAGTGATAIEPETVHVRCPTTDALDNLEKGRGSRMMTVLQHTPNYRDNVPSARVRDDEASEIYRRDRVGVMGSLMQPGVSKPESSSHVGPRCPSAEAKQTWSSSQGSGMGAVMTRSTASVTSAEPAPHKKRVVDQDGNTIDPHGSPGVGAVFESTGQPDSLRPPRVRLDGEEIAVKNRGTVSTVFNYYNKEPVDAEYSPVPRVRPEAQGFADSARGVMTKNLMMKYGQLPGDPKSRPHTNRFSQKIAHQSRGGAMRDALCPPRQKHSKRRPCSAYR